jgi:Arc/MetJ-type ribon-helix-helix transcriptional regulator
MKVTLKPELQRFIDEQIRAGHFATAEEVLEAGVARLMLDSTDDALDEETLDAIERAEGEFERGEDRSFKDFAAGFRSNHLKK